MRGGATDGEGAIQSKGRHAEEIFEQRAGLFLSGVECQSDTGHREVELASGLHCVPQRHSTSPLARSAFTTASKRFFATSGWTLKP